jgi:mannose-1-phosphate guanylyltransferase
VPQRPPDTKPDNEDLYLLILAGGSGERFWPLSRKARPKQLLALAGDTPLLKQTIDRVLGLVPPENILILTNQDQVEGVKAALPDFPPGQIFAEPAKRDTAPAIALGVAWIASRNRAATMIVLPADHVIPDRAAFQTTLRTACEAARAGDLVTIGIRPTWACPGFGYIELGDPVGAPAGGSAAVSVFEVLRFREKPNPELAESFLRKGNFRWNAGMFIWTIPAILSAFERHAPELGTFVEQAYKSPDLPALVRERFPKLPKISIDYAVMEKASRVLMVESGFGWDDVGSWTAAAAYLEEVSGNRSNAPLTSLDASGNIVFTSTASRVALLGVRDLIVVQTPDALLVCRKADAERIKHLVAELPPALQ